jgi:hypothetical protein
MLTYIIERLLNKSKDRLSIYNWHFMPFIRLTANRKPQQLIVAHESQQGSREILRLQLCREQGRERFAQIPQASFQEHLAMLDFKQSALRLLLFKEALDEFELLENMNYLLRNAIMEIARDTFALLLNAILQANPM